MVLQSDRIGDAIAATVVHACVSLSWSSATLTSVATLLLLSTCGPPLHLSLVVKSFNYSRPGPLAPSARTFRSL